MAKLGAYYALCPLIDANSILGISEEVGKGLVIVTLGKNISSRYKLSDQKQLTCWRTKEKFTSLVVYDEHFKKYVAIFNQSYIKIWDLDENLDDSKKYKFNTQLHTLISNGKTTFVVFINGAIHPLQNVIEQRKKLKPEPVIHSKIKNIIYKSFENTFYIGFTVEDDNNFYLATCNTNGIKYTKIDISRDELSLRGLCFHKSKNKMVLLVIWSDGSIFSHSLDESNNSNNCELFATINFISTHHDVSVQSLDENYLVFYGADCNQEGAALIIYNVQFKVVQTRQNFKLFTERANLWLTESAVILPVGQNLAVVPFKLEIEQLVALIGSHKTVQKDFDADVKIVTEFNVVSWVESAKIQDRDAPDLLKDKIGELVCQGMTESTILEQMLPEILANHENKVLLQTLRFFLDIPEKYFVKILKYVLGTDRVHFKGNKCEISGLSDALQPLERVNLLESILKKPFNDTLILPHLRSQLSLNDVLLLLDYIYLIGSDDGYVLQGLTFVETESKLIQWCSLLMDSSYQKIVLSDDKSISEIFEKFNSLIDDHLVCLKDLKEVAPLLKQIKDQKEINKDSKLLNTRYTVEQFSFY